MPSFEVSLFLCSACVHVQLTSGDDRHELAPKMSLSPHCETYWSRITRWIVQNVQILLVSAESINNVCKVQTASAFQGLGPSDLLPGFALDPTGAGLPGLWPWKLKFLVPPLQLAYLCICNQSAWCIRHATQQCNIWSIFSLPAKFGFQSSCDTLCLCPADTSSPGTLFFLRPLFPLHSTTAYGTCK